MTANELADKLDNFYSYVNEPYLLVKTSAMLRQQAQEIEQLKKVLKKIIDISDRKHDAWDEAKNLLQKSITLQKDKK